MISRIVRKKTLLEDINDVSRPTIDVKNVMDGGYAFPALQPDTVDERKINNMPNSYLVSIKKKCTLAGQGNTSSACNQGDINNLKLTRMNENTLNLEELPFKDDIINLGGKIYSVGGAVRDKFLGKESKDLDILITGVSLPKLESILSKYGVVNSVGKSFGILKFKPTGSREDIDIAIPRTETATGGGGHKGFKITSDHTLPIEKDLERRDFTINAIAQSLGGEIIDPYNGKGDLDSKVIRIVNPKAFIEDPLRILRGIQFSARFGFKIDSETMKLMRENSYRVKELAPERILNEFDKIIHKGDIEYGAKLIVETDVYQHIFGKKATIPSGKIWKKVKTMGDFIYLLGKNSVDDIANFYKNTLKGDVNTYKEISALEYGFKNYTNKRDLNRIVAFVVYSMSPIAFESEILPFQNSLDDLKSDKYPKSFKELAVNGNDIIGLGYKGNSVGTLLTKVMNAIMRDKIPNDREKIFEYIAKNK